MDINRNPDLRTLRSFGLILAAFCLVGSLRQPLLYVSAAVILAAISTFGPKILKPVYVGVSIITYPLGWLTSRFLLLLVFFVAVLPTGLVLRMLGRDPLKRKFERSASSYWETKTSPRDLASYLRPF